MGDTEEQNNLNRFTRLQVIQRISPSCTSLSRWKIVCRWLKQLFLSASSDSWSEAGVVMQKLVWGQTNNVKSSSDIMKVVTTTVGHKVQSRKSFFLLIRQKEYSRCLASKKKIDGIQFFRFWNFEKSQN